MKWLFIQIKQCAICSSLYSLGQPVLFLAAISSEVLECFHYPLLALMANFCRKKNFLFFSKYASSFFLLEYFEIERVIYWLLGLFELLLFQLATISNRKQIKNPWTTLGHDQILLWGRRTLLSTDSNKKLRAHNACYRPVSSEFLFVRETSLCHNIVYLCSISHNRNVL